MLGVLWTALFSLLAAAAGTAVVRRFAEGLDPSERLGVGGLVGFGIAGLVTLLVGLLPGGLGFALFAVLAVLLALSVVAVKSGALNGLKPSLQGAPELLAVAALVVIGLLALIAVLAPSVGTDWDTIAYHLAVPKLWLQQGQIGYIQGIHHSNFPSTMEMLFMWGLEWGGQSGAKTFSLMVYVFGCLALFGLARRWYSRGAGWWAAIAFAGIPVVAWESGTGYIDVAHGLYAALGACYAVEAYRFGGRPMYVLAGVCLGFALGTKYTGLQVLFAVAVVVGVAALVGQTPHPPAPSPPEGRGGVFANAVRASLTVVLVALAIAGPWYIKTAVYTGNPVYPFFSSVLGGRDWDAWRAEIYKAEQKSFGVGSSIGNLGHAVLGLGYQPGRYTNPRQDTGGGFPTGAIGFAALLAGVCAATSGRLRREERLILAIVGLGFLMWFFLSQQSRYLTMLAIPLGVLGAGMVSRVRWGPVLAGALALQAGVTVYLINTMQTKMQLQVVTGKVSEDEYLSATLAPFYSATKTMNALPVGSKVALYDEVFGFYLDVPYFWANPGHSMFIPYESLSSGEEYAAKMKELGFTHAYVNLVFSDKRFRDALSNQEPYTEQEWAEMSKDLNHKWKLLLADAANKGLVKDVSDFERAALGEFVR